MMNDNKNGIKKKYIYIINETKIVENCRIKS